MEKGAVFLSTALLLAPLAMPTAHEGARGGQRPARSGKYRWINPLLDLDESLEFPEIRPFKGKVQILLGSLRKELPLTHVSLYYRDLNNGPWFGIAEKEGFVPASLLKVPFMMALLRKAEEGPELLRWTLAYDAADAVPEGQHFSTGTRLAPGTPYSVDSLLEAMVRASDNRAAMMLFDAFGTSSLADLYEDLGISAPKDNLPTDLTVKQYASFFRILYNSSYLNWRMSEKALDLLAGSEFKEGLEAGMPGGIAVAHKYGERLSPDGTSRQLHDCGIVYHPRSPYLLCVMTRGNDYKDMAEVIRRASALVFKEVDRQAPVRRD